uniref:Uncharacterized protein n=1 Tax=Picea sitchensis TaxID=3332 RepID=A0A6B9XQK4_PICSI|nr:hypothetical protein Q903MT_gene4387 [Picea sitchensis]
MAAYCKSIDFPALSSIYYSRSALRKGRGSDRLCGGGHLPFYFHLYYYYLYRSQLQPDQLLVGMDEKTHPMSRTRSGCLSAQQLGRGKDDGPIAGRGQDPAY